MSRTWMQGLSRSPWGLEEGLSNTPEQQACTLRPPAYSPVKSIPAPGETLQDRKQTSSREEHVLLFRKSSDARSGAMVLRRC